MVFCMENGSDMEFSIPFIKKVYAAPAYIFLLIFFVVGCVSGYITSLSDILKAKRQNRIEQQKQKQVECKLAVYEEEIRIMDNIRNSNLKLQQSTINQQILLQK